MKKKIITGVVILVVSIAIILTGVVLFQINKVELNLPEEEMVKSITAIEGEKEVVINDYIKIEKVLELLDRRDISFTKSVQDGPLTGDKNIVKLDIKLNNDNVMTAFVYERNNKYYLEVPYSGVFKLSKKVFNEMQNLVK